MLRPEKILALDDVTEACQEAVDHFTQFADSVAPTAMTRLFADLAERHRQHVAWLDEQVQRLGELPSRPDPDREALEQVATWVRAAFAERREEALVDKALEYEERIGEALAKARQRDLPEAARSLLADMAADVEACRERLTAARTP